MELIKDVIEALDHVKASEIKIYDLRGISPLADFTIIATVDVIRQANAVIETLDDKSREKGFTLKGVEGRDSTWILVDMCDIILHVFTRDERLNYNLDRLYIDVPKLEPNDYRDVAKSE